MKARANARRVKRLLAGTADTRALLRDPFNGSATRSPPAWVPCYLCGDFLCTIHGVHVHDCECPAIEEWGDVDPYTTGGRDEPFRL